MHTNRFFLFASFAIVRSFFSLFVQYDYHINQCNTSLLNKHRIIYKVMRASLMQQDGHDTDRTQHHSRRQHRPHTHSHAPRQTRPQPERLWIMCTAGHRQPAPARPGIQSLRTGWMRTGQHHSRTVAHETETQKDNRVGVIRPSHTTQRAVQHWAVRTNDFMNLSATVSKYSSMVRRPFFFRCIFLIYLFRNVTAQRTHPCRAHAYE